MSAAPNGDVNPNTVVARPEDGLQPASDENQTTPNPEQRQPSTMETVLSTAKSLIVRALIIYFITSFFRKQMAPPVETNPATTGMGLMRNLFSDGTRLSLYVYLSEAEDLQNFSSQNLFWYKDGLIYGDWTGGPNKDGTFLIEKDVEISDNMRNNGSLYLHAFITRSGKSPDPQAENYAKSYQSQVTIQLNKYKKLKSSIKKNLLTGASQTADVDEGKIISHWHPNLTLNLLTDRTEWKADSFPNLPNFQFKLTDDNKYYRPFLFVNDLWNMERDYHPLNETFSLRLLYQPLSFFKCSLYSTLGNLHMNSYFDEKVENDEEQDKLKELLMYTNLYLLGFTICISLLHSVFELLAFKNDIQFWNNRNSLEGLSVRSVFFGVFQSLVLLLYVLDNETVTLIRISCFIGLGIELWKVYKVVDVRIDNGRLVFKDKGSYSESSTKVYDNLAFKYLSWLCFPLLIGYSIYALLYLEHKGWYSFVLELLYGYLLTFGFIMMTPQLFINYKLKSVAHLPWRMLTYKFLNTIIDDLFAFVIKTPTMYRIGCFRDDIIFIIFLYQRWIYPVDFNRKNEYGNSAEEMTPIDQQETSQQVAVVEEDKKNI